MKILRSLGYYITFTEGNNQSMLENSENYTQVINIGLNHQFEKKLVKEIVCKQFYTSISSIITMPPRRSKKYAGGKFNCVCLYSVLNIWFI